MDFIKDIKHNGYSKISNIFLENEKEILINSTKSLLKEEYVDYKFVNKEPIYHDVSYYDIRKNIFTFFKTLNRNFLGCDRNLDNIFNKLFSDKKIKNILKEILGKDYKIHTCLIRKADENSSYLGLHTDNDNCFTMSVLCNDINSNMGTTVFIPESHKYYYSFRNSIEKINPIFFNLFIKPSIGRTGDINCFFNKTLHGVKRNSDKNNKSNIILLIGLHKNSNKNLKTLLLPERTLYGKKFEEILCPDALNLFELKSDKRKIIVETSLSIIDEINQNSFKKVKFSLNFLFFKFIEISLKLLKKTYYRFKTIA